MYVCMYVCMNHEQEPEAQNRKPPDPQNLISNAPLTPTPAASAPPELGWPFKP